MSTNGFNANEEIEKIVAWIQDWFENNGPKANAVIGVSGGKDSSIVSALLVKALGKDRVVGVLMPNGEQKDIADSKKLVEFLGIRHYIVNINPAVEGEYAALRAAGIEVGKDAIINTPPRIRMTTLYAVAQSLPEGGRVANTCNKSEDWVGYSTKYGDAAGDFSPCSDYLVSEMLQIGDALGLPTELIHKTPSDGLSGMSDEDKLGFTYAVLDHYVLTGEIEDQTTKEKIDRLHRLNLHKLQTIPMYKRG
ncbi:NAD(+) synthase [Butyrivibrio sp. CB08]|uniref:NAD(+) synthase n=1 Tax=Butyrivibrio sp. CB08 TaxID=2364879 RepID=UPI000EA871C9|nr:NAD(+) synthase [Butyrivibrio sp. CB08]RKM57947.1 NAD(+) synthase [Butyrivibrio sp. CB08]